MSARVTDLWRHPIKSHGRERLDRTVLVSGQAMPFDRHWAVTHANSKFDADNPEWVMCRNFMLGTLTPKLAGINATFFDAEGRIELTHRDLGQITFRPDNPADTDRFIAWLKPLSEGDALQPVGLARLPGRGLTDTDFPSVSVMNMASHRAVGQRIGRQIEPERWRGNVWLDGLAPWEEFDWIGKRIRVGETVLDIVEPIRRCKHTMANPVTGIRDTDTLTALREGWGHQDFGVYARVIEGGAIATGDSAQPA